MEEAKQYAAMAGRYMGTENQLMIRLLDGEEAAAFCQWNIATLVDLISVNASVMLEKGTYTDGEYIQATEQMLKLYALIYNDGNYGFCHSRISQWYLRMAKRYAQMEDREKTLESLQHAADHAEAFDKRTAGRYTALLVNRRTYDAHEHERSQVEACLRKMQEDCFRFLWADSQFAALRLQVTQSLQGGR